jgi:hypothetical protein
MKISPTQIVKVSNTAPTAKTNVRYLRSTLRNSGRGWCANLAMNGKPTFDENMVMIWRGKSDRAKAIP